MRGPSQPLLRPACSPARLRQPSATPPAPAPGLPPLPAACRGPRPGPRRGSPRSPPPARQGGAGRAGLAAWAAGAAVSAGPGSRAGGGGPTTAASASLRSSRSARVSPVHSGEGDGGAGAGPAVVAVVSPEGPIGVCHHCYSGRHAWWQARPSHYLLVHQCRAVGSAVWCSAGGGGRGWGAGCGVSPARPGVRGHPPALGGEAGEPRGPRVAPQLPVWGGAQGPGPPGGRRAVSGAAAPGGPP